ncbi:hypothetical protein [Robertkochia aurantiaca]|uniref:hypothetical protein n=1 Tax=Robertkochia aurantiaca TaxID=2873700 RepID=UPI001CCCADCF|nr:hypothetical protein [Robertkochia sp. 3YJGBD-33]
MKTPEFLFSALIAIFLLACTNDLSDALDEELIIDVNAKANNTGNDFVADNPEAAREISRLRKAVSNIRTIEDAIAAGWNIKLTPYLQNMGYHLGNGAYLDDGEFYPDKPEALLMACNEKGDYVVVGAEYIVPKAGAYENNPPEGFTGDADEWALTAGTLWTLHAWIKTPNPDGFFNAPNIKIPLTDQCSGIDDYEGLIIP